MKKIILSLLLLIVACSTLMAQSQMQIKLHNGSSLNYDVSEIKDITWDVSTPDDPEYSGNNNPKALTVTGDAIDITGDSASVIAYANNILEIEASDFQVGIIYSTSDSLNKNNGTQLQVSKSEVADNGMYTIALGDLTRGTTYYYRSFVYMSGFWFYGEVRSFTTKSQEIDAQFMTGAATNVTCYSATVSAQLTLKTALPYENLSYGFSYASSVEAAKELKVDSIDADGNFSATLRALTGNTIYYFCPFVRVDTAIYYGQPSAFVTLADNVVQTGDADSLGWVSSRLTISEGAYSKLEVGHCWSGKNATPTVVEDSKCSSKPDEESYFSHQIKGLGTIYYRAYVKIDGVAHYGAVKKIEKPNGCDVVDLGLSVKWATCNIGAQTPSGYGDSFAWGETESKDEYNWDRYKYTGGYGGGITKYFGYRNELEADDDAATVNWGKDWRTPTYDDIKELIEKCSWKCSTLNGVNGYSVKGPNGNSIFLPAVGYISNDNRNDCGWSARYWCNSVGSSSLFEAICLICKENVDLELYEHQNRCDGLAIRPVYHTDDDD